MKIENSIAHIVPPHFPLCRAMNDHAASSYGKAKTVLVTCLNKQCGFTLIEVIVTLVIVAILASMSYSFFGTSITQSGMPVVRLSKAMELQTVMENITADYKSLYGAAVAKQFDLDTLKTRIGVEGTTYSTNYGSYKVIDNHFIKFTSYNEDTTSPGNNLLKVTLQGTSTGEMLTVLFSQS